MSEKLRPSNTAHGDEGKFFEDSLGGWWKVTRQGRLKNKLGLIPGRYALESVDFNQDLDVSEGRTPDTKFGLNAYTVVFMARLRRKI